MHFIVRLALAVCSIAVLSHANAALPEEATRQAQALLELAIGKWPGSVFKRKPV